MTNDFLKKSKIKGTSSPAPWLAAIHGDLATESCTCCPTTRSIKRTRRSV